MADTTRQQLNVVITAQDQASAQVAKIGKSIEDLGREAEKSGQSWSQFASAFKGGLFGGILGAFGVGSATQMFSSFVGSMRESAKSIADLGSSAEMLGITARQLATLEIASIQLTGSSEGLVQQFRNFERVLGDAARGSEPAIKLFEELGVVIVDSNGNMRSAYDVLVDVAKQFDGGKLGVKEMSFAMDLFGRSSANAGVVLRGLSGELTRSEAIAKSLSGTTDEATRAYDEQAKASALLTKQHELQDTVLKRLLGTLEIVGKKILYNEGGTLVDESQMFGGKRGGLTKFFEDLKAADMAKLAPKPMDPAVLKSYREFIDAATKFQTLMSTGRGAEQDILDYVNAFERFSGIDVPTEAVTQLIELFHAQGELVDKMRGYTVRPIDMAGELAFAPSMSKEAQMAAVDAMIAHEEEMKRDHAAAMEYFKEMEKFNDELHQQQILFEQSTNAVTGLRLGIQEYVNMVGGAGDQMKRLALGIAQGMEAAFTNFFFNIVMGEIRTMRDALASILKMLAQVFASVGAQFLSQTLVAALGIGVGSALGGISGPEAPGLQVPNAPGFAAPPSLPSTNSGGGGQRREHVINLIFPGVDAHSAAQFLVKHKDSIKGIFMEALHSDASFRSGMVGA